MRDVMRRVHNERGFTLAEMLVVMLILGCLSAIAVLSITRFLGSGAAEAANTEVHNAHAAIFGCIADAGAGHLDTDVPVNWDGSDNVVTATGAGGVVYDAADSLRGRRLKATYTVTPEGEITGATDQEWPGVVWEDGRWKKEKKDK
jgi:prepilin-type N-terminal cleavage/methylation domain-containing protein